MARADFPLAVGPPMMKMRDMSDYPYILTLIATPPLSPVTEDMVNAVRGVLLTTDTPQWLEPKVAVDIPFSGTTPQEAREAVKLALMGKQVDVVIQPQKGRRKLMLLADMDGTIMREESLDELADCAGKKLDVASITVRAMRGELDFEGALKARVAMLKGLPASSLGLALKRLRPMPGAERLLQRLREEAIPAHLVSGGFTFFTEAVANQLGFASHRGNSLGIDNGRLTGEVIPPILGKQAKVDRMMELIPNPADVLAVGDGANDIPMLQTAGLGIAFRAKPAAKAAAHAVIEHSDLTALLYVIGLRG